MPANSGAGPLVSLDEVLTPEAWPPELEPYCLEFTNESLTPADSIT
jgi:hypothetical protein